MTAEERISNLPPAPKILDYPGATGIGIGIVFVAAILFVSSKFDPTGGQLTISILVMLAFFTVVSVCLFYNIPNDEITSGAIGGLIAAFGAVVAFWLGGRGRPPE